MARYFVVDEGLLRQAVLAEEQVSDPRAAVEAVPGTTPLPDRVAVIKAADINIVQVVDGDQPSPDFTVERPAAP